MAPSTCSGELLAGSAEGESQTPHSSATPSDAAVEPRQLCGQHSVPFNYSVFDEIFLVNFIKFTFHIKTRAIILANGCL